MSHVWENPRRLPVFWRWALRTVRAVGPIAFTALTVLHAWDKVANPIWFWVTIGVGVFTAGAALALECFEHFGTHHKAYFECLLAELGREIWKSQPEKLVGPLDQHRITLFQLRRRPKYKWLLDKVKKECWTHELVPRLRDPPSGARPKRLFRIHTRRSELSEGVAGQVFHASPRAIVTPELPDVSTKADVAEEIFREFADLTKDNWKTVRQERYDMRIIGGVTIYVRGHRWGALVLDSSDPSALPHRRFDHKVAKMTLRVLSSIIEREQL